jgi:hypothetical protein
MAGPSRALRLVYRGAMLFTAVVPLTKVFADLLQRLRATP